MKRGEGSIQEISAEVVLPEIVASWTTVMAVRAGQILDGHVESEADRICSEEVRA